MKKTNRRRRANISKYRLIAIILLIFICLFVWKGFKNTKLTRTTSLTTIIDPTIIQYEEVEDILDQPITPILHSTGANYYRFIHPLNHFSFIYPIDWRISVYKRHPSRDLYRVVLSISDDGSDRIHFETGGRDYPQYDYEETVFKTLGGRTTSWKTLYDDGKAVELMVGFPNNDFGEDLTGLYVYLPETEQDSVISQLENLVASLK